MLTKLGQRGYAVHELSGDYALDRIDTDTDPDTDNSAVRISQRD